MKDERKSEMASLMELTQNHLPPFCSGYLLNRENERALNSRLGYAKNLKIFFEYVLDNYEYFYGKKVTEILPEDLARITPQYIDIFLMKYSEGKKPATVARMKSSISSMYSYACNTLQALSYNPTLGAQKIKIPAKNYVVYLTPSEQQRLLDGIRLGTGLTNRELAHHKKYIKRDLALVFLLLDTGLRASEIQGADNRDLNMEACSIIVTRKGGDRCEVFFSDESAEYLKDYLEEKKILHPCACGPTDPLILSRDEGRLTVRQYENIVPKYVKAVLPERYESINCHKIRSSFAMCFYMRDPNHGSRDILALQERMNHKNLATTNIYAKAASNVSKQTRNWREDMQ